MADDEVASLFRHIDQDETGRIHYTEWLAAAMEQRWYLSEEKLASTFAWYV